LRRPRLDGTHCPQYFLSTKQAQVEKLLSHGEGDGELG